MTIDEQEAVEQAIVQGEFTLPGVQYEWLSPLCCVAWDEKTSTLTIGDETDCQVLSYSEALGLLEFLERVLPAPSIVLENS